MIFTEHLFRTFVLINFFASLAKSNIVYTFEAMVRSATPLSITTPMYTFRPQLLRAHLAKYSQSSPVLGICFCLIMVRLGRIFPVAQGEDWDTSRTYVSDRVAALSPKVAAG